MNLWDVRYARSGDVSVGYQVLGDGPIDLVFVAGFFSNLVYGVREPRYREFLESLTAAFRVIRFDRRGTGVSDRPRDVPTLEARMDDMRAVMAAAGSRRAAVFATYEAAPMALLFAATHPERVGALVLYNGYAKAVSGDGYPWGHSEEEWFADLDDVAARWGTDEYFDEVLRDSFPSVAHDEDFRRHFIDQMRLSASPGAALTISRMAMDIDVRDVLPAIRVPTLVLHRPFARGMSEFIGDRIGQARCVELPGRDAPIYLGEPNRALEEIERFVREAWHHEEPETVLSTVLFTDIVGSTARTAEIGDARWRDLVERHHAVVRGQLDRFRGREVDTAGDGFFATFDGPIRAIRCACGIREAMRDLGLDLRFGLHTGECERVGDKIAGLAVNIGSRVAALAGAGEVLVSSTVRDLVAGSGIDFEDRGTHELKGVPGEWRVYAVSDS